MVLRGPTMYAGRAALHWANELGGKGVSVLKLRVLLVSMVAALGLSTGTALANGGPIMPLSDVAPGMDCTAQTVIQGTTITTFNVHVVDIVQDPQFGLRILVNVSGPAVDSTGIAQGMSGSPVYCPMPDGSLANAGAISSGVPGTTQGEVTPIEQMLSEPVLPPPAAATDTRYHASLSRMRPLLGPLTIGGLSPALMNIIERAALRAGRLVVTQPQGAGSTNFPVQPLVPGASVAVSYSTGAISIGAVGTVTYRDGQNVYAFGHEFDGAGRRSLLLQDAWVDGVASNPSTGAFKLAAPGHSEGILTSDTPSAVIGTVGAGPTLVPVDVAAHDLDTGNRITLYSQVADETDIGLPLGASLVDAVAPLEAGQAATQIFNGPPAFESGRMCVQIWLRESRTPLGFCNHYVGSGSAGDSGVPPELASAVGTDMTSAFSLLEQVAFAKLHVTRVSAQIDAQRGLAEGSLVSVQGPMRVHRGQLVTVHLLVQLFRGGTRTVTLRLRIPRHVRGLYTALLHGPSPVLPSGTGPASNALSGGLAALLGGLGSGPSTPPPPAPVSMAQLRSEIADIGPYDGLILSSPGRRARHLFDDPTLLITGSAPVAFLVK